jgi:hypothetical protein
MPDSPNSSLNRPRWLPDLLATRSGRLTAFFFLYVSEGIPLGFTATAVATQMRRQGLTPGQSVPLSDFCMRRGRGSGSLRR